MSRREPTASRNSASDAGTAATAVTSAAAPPPLVALRDVWVSRGGRDILRGVTADIARGKITGLIGLNGSGKTTLLRAVVGEYPHRGRIEFRCGHDHSRPTPKYVGYVPQRLVVDARLPLTVRDLFGLALSRRPIFLGIPRRVIARASELLLQVGLSDVLDVPIEGLSGGQLQRVLLALALEPSPELLLLDEPAAGIDFKDQIMFYELIARLNRETDLTVLMVSHDLRMLASYSHHVLCLKDGRVVRQGSAAEMLDPSNLAAVFGPMYVPGLSPSPDAV